MGLFLRKNHLLRCWVWLLLLNWIVALTSLLLKLPSRKCVLWSFFLLRLLCISINLPYTHTWNTFVTWVDAPSCYLGIVREATKMDIQDCWPFTESIESLGHRRNVASSPFYSYYFGRCSSELVQSVPHPYSSRLHDFPGIFPDYSGRLHDCMIMLVPHFGAI